ncbi:BREX-1 system adenine-specific DNA-methyltransferase PglX [Lactobacillus paracasei]|uniref:BREX-1 system adenine-specific DNA-methyltransferase PglX n=1 Tax=Lacticaseibacillus paracasei TaxID=1597 RepID=UPI001436C71C|nr:BREX-1 system adenine-specific DNA-methyltransferase PglX [Lacticaseibacillus paracasei]MCT3315941.1 BREX-1 system adenine-specific DNA-methyltransferase PglX [Lacticaseibacillus paracasei]NKF03281.1 BREX-1 system adenine-specific DNA-methyltransferase PglX [Lacticaseibacillus paracasei]
MDKKAIKTFAIQARRSLIESIKLKLENLGITKDGVAEKMSQSTNEIEYYGDKGLSITGQDIRRRRELVARLKGMAKQEEWSDALTDLIEEVAYTWFNRIIAIRFMEVNEYLPSGVRVLSSETKLKVPDILREAFEIEDDLGGYSVDEHEIIQKALDTEDPTDMDAAYVILFTKQANALNHYLPELFEKTDDFMQLLFTPSYSSGVIKDLVDDIKEDDFDVDKGGQVEIIGWLYQYYNIEPHDKVVNINGGPIKTNDIPAATQLFTTDWVVRYMVDNSLGRLYLEYFPDSPIKANLTYLLPGPIETRTDSFDLSKLKVLDDAMGSGHILVYAFDLLIQMYEEQGYGKRDATDAILAHNLYGLEIDKRAYQLAYFALMMKARQYNRRILSKPVRHNLHVFESTVDVPNEVFEKMNASKDTIGDLHTLVSIFKQAKLLGSIMHFEKKFDFDALFSAVNSLPDSTQLDLFGLQAAKNSLLGILKIAQVLQTHFDVVATNPPYLNRMNGDLKKYVKKYYKAYSGDLFSVFIWKNIEMTKQDGYSAYMTPFVWMFIKTYEGLRKSILDSKQISSLIQMEYSAFEEATVPINTFVLKNDMSADSTGTYLKLSDFKGGMEVQRRYVLKAVADPSVSYLYRTKQTNFEKIPGSPIAYWASNNLIRSFEIGTPLKDLVQPKVGLQTGDNNRFLRQWYEVEPFRISFTSTSTEDALKSGEKWFPYNKGGSYRKWYGNYDYVVNWQDDGYEIKHFVDFNGKVRSRPQNTDYYFREAITWSDVTSGHFSMRYRKEGSIFDVVGMSLFSSDTKRLLQILLFSNTKVMNYIMSFLNPTIHASIGYVSLTPIIFTENTAAFDLANQCLANTEKDWNSYENSWSFQKIPLLDNIADHHRNWTVEGAFKQWQKEADDRFNQLKANEEELNRIFIDLYGLQDELSPEEEDKDVSVRRACLPRDIKAFMSYFIGCVFGRYSIDTPGLAYAGGDWDASKYKTFIPNEDDVILLTDDDYFGDDRDVMNRFKEFLTTSFGSENLNENLKFIADALGKRGESSEEKIRAYLRDDFFKKDHLSTYQKRPIYWEFNSGRNGGFKALMYLHRYDRNTVAMIRTKYLHPLQEAYERKLVQQKKLEEDEQQTRQKNKYKKRITTITKELDELIKYDEKLQHVANLHIDLDLDDGVLVNHAKAQADTKILTPLK